jgi:hypothetical protein
MRNNGRSAAALWVAVGLLVLGVLAGLIVFPVVERTVTSSAVTVISETGSSTASGSGFPVLVVVVILIAIITVAMTVVQTRMVQSKRKRRYDEPDLDVDALADDYIDLPEGEETAGYFEGDVLDLDEKPKRSSVS